MPHSKNKGHFHTPVDVHRVSRCIGKGGGEKANVHRDHPMRSDITFIKRQRGPVRMMELDQFNLNCKYSLWTRIGFGPFFERPALILHCFTIGQITVSTVTGF